MRKRIFDEAMSEYVETLIFILNVDAVVFDRRAEAVDGRRDDREVTSQRCRIGTSKACYMPYAHSH